MFGSAISRWTMLYFGAALVCFVLAQIIAVSGLAFPVASLFSPMTLAALHLVTIGWLTLLMLGALHQFLPVITAQGRTAGHSALVAFLAVLAGLGGMEAGFLALDGRLPDALLPALPIGGCLVLIGAGVAVVSFSRVLLHTRPLPFPARFIAAGLVFLLIAVVLGITRGLAFASPGLLSWPAEPEDGLRLHVLAGLLGWFGLTAIGVSYRLLSMFTLAPEDRGALGTAVFTLTVGGLVLAWLSILARAMGAPLPQATLAPGAMAVVLGVLLYLVDMVRLFRGRRRFQLELNTSMAIPALIALGSTVVCTLALCAAAWLGWTVPDRLPGALGYLFLFGWLSGLGLSQLYKIVPFLTWLERYGSRLGQGAVPRVQDLVDEGRDRPWFILYFAAVAAGAACAAAGWAEAWRICVSAHLIATLMILRALWLARYGEPRPRQNPPFPLTAHSTESSS